ncbi:MAG: HPr family phosphocarrier protein [Xanthobacteraceae bacterium]
MNDPAHSAGIPGAGQASDGAVSRVFVICNKKGLHARASAKFVQTVEKYDAEVRVWRNADTVGDAVGGTSIMGLMMLAAAPGTSITIEATGREATEVLEALAALISSRFGEAD